MDPVKEAFVKAKQDISELREEVSSLKQSIEEIKYLISNPTSIPQKQTNQQKNPTQMLNEPLKPAQYSLKEPNTLISIGNRGVPTNKQTNKQTDNSTQDSQEIHFQEENQLSSVLNSFNTIKEQLKTKFKSLTKQEMSVFVAVYMLEEKKKTVDYRALASHLGLTETSIRDYILKMTRKDIPIIKSKQNNKKILFSIDPNLKKLAPLSSLILLREPTERF